MCSLPHTACAQSELRIQNNLFELSSSRAAAKRLDHPQQFQYEQRPLAAIFHEIAQASGLSVWIDRRVDRSRHITLSSSGSLQQLIQNLATAGGAEAALVENILYVGPRDEVAKVQLAAVRLHNELMLKNKSKNAELRNLVWEELTTPSQLVRSLEKQWSIQIAVDLPHDLMHAGELTECTLATQVTLALAGFGLQAQCGSANSLVTETLSARQSWTALYDKNQLLTIRELNARSAEFPGAKVDTSSNPFEVTGPTNFHLAVLKNTSTPTRRPMANGKSEPKFKIPKFYAPVSTILDQLAKKQMLKVEWSAAIPLAERQQPMTLHVPTEKTFTEILQMIATESRLSIKLEGDVIKVDTQN